MAQRFSDSTSRALGPGQQIHAENHLDGFCCYKDASGHARWRFSPSDRHLAGLRFGAPQETDLPVWAAFFEGVDHSPRLMELWHVMCYQVLKQRGIWEMDIAVEQRLHGEFHPPYSGVPAAPAAIQ